MKLRPASRTKWQLRASVSVCCWDTISTTKRNLLQLDYPTYTPASCSFLNFTGVEGGA